MKLILVLGILLLNACAPGVFGPEAQERAKARMQQAREQMAQAREQIRAGFTQLGNALDQTVSQTAQGVGTFASGYAQAYQEYQATQPASTQQTGLINTPNGSALYHVDANGNGIIYPPVGSGDGRAIMFHTDSLGNVWEY